MLGWPSHACSGLRVSEAHLRLHRHNDIVVSVIPPFDHRTGNLPPGVHRASWEEVVERYATTTHRRHLLDGLYGALLNLADAGCTAVLLDGSFVSSTPFPRDYDGVWEIEAVDANRLDPVLMDFSAGRAAMKAKYAGELFPSDRVARPGIPFVEFFQEDRSGERKGIVRIDLQELR